MAGQQWVRTTSVSNVRNGRKRSAADGQKLAGERAASCATHVPRRIFFVSAAMYASGVIASELYVSDVHTRRSRARPSSPPQLGGIEATTEWAQEHASESYRGVYSRLLPSESWRHR